MTRQDTPPEAAVPHLREAAESIAAMERARRECHAAQTRRDAAMRRAHEAGMRPPSIARWLSTETNVPVSTSLAYLATTPRWEPSRA